MIGILFKSNEKAYILYTWKVKQTVYTEEKVPSTARGEMQTQDNVLHLYIINFI